MLNVTIVIPFLNEEQSLPSLLPQIDFEISRMHHNIDVILVNDSSTDNSAQICESFINSHSRFKLINSKYKNGQTGAFQTAFELIKSEYIVRMDADLQDDPIYLPAFIEKLEKGYDVVIGKRIDRQHNQLLIILTSIYDIVVGMITRSRLNSNSGSMVAYKTHLLKNVVFFKNDHRYFPLIAKCRGGKKSCTVEVVHRKRLYGNSHYSVKRKLLYGLPEIINFLWRYYSGYYRITKDRLSDK